MSAIRRSAVFRKHNLRGRTAKILALVPIQHAPSDTSDKSDVNSDNELADLHTQSLASSSSPSLDSVLERLHILSSPEPDLPTPESFKTKTRAQKQIAPIAKRPKKVPKFTLTYKWKKSATFNHRAIIEINHENNTDSLDYFNKFFSPDIVSGITEQTNLYSVQQTGKSMQVTGNEICDFIAIHILVGIVPMPCYLDYWSSRFRYASVAEIMSLKRYQQIRRFLHFADNSLEDGDRYYKVRPVAEKIRLNCLRQEDENKFSVDEMMI